jgi:predicted TPR repeat methyltransferase
MYDQLPFLVPPYSALAEVYDHAGFSDYARQSIPRYISYAQSIDWAGRRVLDLGCGTGVTTWYVAQQGYRVIGIDSSASMLAHAQVRGQMQSEEAQTGSLVFDAPSFVQMDIRQLESPMGAVDMVLAVGGVLNAIQSLRELEGTFTLVNKALDEGKLFIFDIRTIRGLAVELGNADTIYYDNSFNLSIIARSQFSFETLSNTHHYMIFQQQGMAWQRQDEIHVERGYPTQGVAAILERTGFEVRGVLTPDIEPFDAQADPHGRVVFVAQKR